MVVVYRYVVIIMSFVICCLGDPIDLCSNKSHSSGNIQCKLKNVSIQIPETNNDVFRLIVVVTRCVSDFNKDFKCVPEIENVTYKIPSHNSSNKCNIVTVEKHTKCQMKRNVKKRNCETLCTTGTIHDKNCNCVKKKEKKQRKRDKPRKKSSFQNRS